MEQENIFKNAIQKSIKNGEKATANASEIEGVLCAYGEALQESIQELVGSGNKVVVDFHDPHGPSLTLSEEIRDSVKKSRGTTLSAFSDCEVSTKSYTLSANFNGEHRWEEILKYDMDPITSYPCSIVYKGKNVACGNKRALINALMKATEELGSVIFIMISRFVKPQGK